MAITQELRAILTILEATPHKTPTVRPPTPYHDSNLDEPDMQDTAGEANELHINLMDTMAAQKQDDQLERTISSYWGYLGKYLWTIREGQGYPCYQRDMMITDYRNLSHIKWQSNFLLRGWRITA